MNSVAVQRDLAKFKETFLKADVKKDDLADKTASSSLDVSKLNIRVVPNLLELFSSKIKENKVLSTRIPTARTTKIEEK